MIIIMIALYSFPDMFFCRRGQRWPLNSRNIARFPTLCPQPPPFCPRHTQKAKNTETRKTVTTTRDGRRVVVSGQFVFNLGQPFG